MLTPVTNYTETPKALLRRGEETAERRCPRRAVACPDEAGPLSTAIVDPRTVPGWDSAVATHPAGGLFHTNAWLNVLTETYGYRPFYISSFRNKRLAALLPIMEVNSPLGGGRGVSLPFTDFCDILFERKAQVPAMIAAACALGRKRNWNYCEFRSHGQSRGNVPPYSLFFDHTLDLCRTEDTLFKGLHSTVRRNIRKAAGKGVTVSFRRSREAVRDYYRLHCLTRKKHGLPPQPYRFFESIYKHIIARKLGFVALASCKGKNIAGAVYFTFNRRALFKFGASDAAYLKLRPNNLVMWEAVKRLSREGIESLSLGRTEKENQGLRRYKSGFGTVETEVAYYRYDLRNEAYVAEKSPRYGVASAAVLNRLPVVLLRALGSVMYKHMG